MSVLTAIALAISACGPGNREQAPGSPNTDTAPVTAPPSVPATDDGDDGDDGDDDGNQSPATSP